MKLKTWLIGLGVVGMLCVAQVALSAPVTPVGGGGTSTSTAPVSGQILIGNASGTYTVAYLTPGTNITISTSSGGITINSTGGSGSGSSTTVFGINGVTVTALVGGNQTSSLNLSYPAAWVPTAQTTYTAQAGVNYGNSITTGGVINLNGSTNTSTVLVVTNNVGANATGRLAIFNCQNVNDIQDCVTVYGNSSSATALNVKSWANGKGGIKIEQETTSSDANASSLSIDIGAGGGGTSAQGIHVDATNGGTKGNLADFWNNGGKVMEVSSASVQIYGNFRAASTTSALLITDPSGNVSAYAGSNPCGANEVAKSISALGVITCQAVVYSVNGSTGAVTITSSSLGIPSGLVTGSGGATQVTVWASNSTTTGYQNFSWINASTSLIVGTTTAIIGQLNEPSPAPSLFVYNRISGAWASWFDDFGGNGGIMLNDPDNTINPYGTGFTVGYQGQPKAIFNNAQTSTAWLNGDQRGDLDISNQDVGNINLVNGGSTSSPGFNIGNAGILVNGTTTLTSFPVGTFCVHAVNGQLKATNADCGSGSGSSSITFYANGQLFVTTGTIKFSAGSNVTIATSSDGTYTISSSASGGGGLASSTPWTANTIPFIVDGSTLQGSPDLTYNSSTGQTRIIATSSDHAGTSQSVGGQLNINTTNTTSSAFVVYSSQGANQAGNLVRFMCDNPAWANNTDCVNILDAASSATALNVVGSSTAKGVVKITLNAASSGVDQSNAATLSLLVNSTSGQMIFGDTSASGTTGKQINLRDKGIEYLTFQIEGNGFTVRTTSTFASTTVIGTLNGLLQAVNGVVSASSLSQSNGTTFINGSTPILDGGGDYIGPNILMTSANNTILQNPTSSLVAGNLVQGGGVTLLNTSTTLSGSQFCGGGLFYVVNTTAPIVITTPSTSTIGGSPCASGIYSGNFSEQFVSNQSTNTVSFATNGSNEFQIYQPGTPTILQPGQEMRVTGQFEASSTIQGATSTGMNFYVKYEMYQTSTPFFVSGQGVVVSSTIPFSATAINASTTLNAVATTTLLGNVSVGTTTFKNGSTSFQVWSPSNELTASSGVTLFLGDASSSRPGCIAMAGYPTGTAWGYMWFTFIGGLQLVGPTSTPCP